jgi:hypothetical protein
MSSNYTKITAMFGKDLTDPNTINGIGITVVSQ